MNFPKFIRAPFTVLTLLLVVGHQLLPTLAQLPAAQKKKAIAALDKLSPRDFFPNAGGSSVEVLIMTGRMYNNLGSANEGLGYFEKAMRKAPNDAAALAWYGYGLMENWRFADALPIIDKAVKLDPKCATAFAVRGRCLYRLKRMTGSSQALAHAFELDPKNFVAHQMAARNYTDSLQDDRALEHLNKLVALYPDLVLPYKLRGALYERLGKMQLAMADYDQVVKLGPGCFLGYYARGHLRYLLGQFQQALADFTKVRTLDTCGAPLQKTTDGIVDCHEKLGQYNKVIEDLAPSIDNYKKEATKKLDADQQAEVLRRAGCYKHLKDYPRALSDANFVLRCEPGSADGLQLRAEIFQATGDHKRAVADYSSLLANIGGNTQWYRRRAHSLTALGREEAAKKDLHDADELDGK